MFKEKVVIVTGASQGIGRQVALEFAKAGAKVVVADVAQKCGQAVVEEVLEQGGTAIFVKCDVRKPEDITELMEITKQKFGPVDVLINNAGKVQWKSPLEVTVEEWEDIIHTNLRSTFLCAREAAKQMIASGGGRIVNIASTRATMSEPHTESYAATKGGILALTHALAASFSNQGITVNAVSPGWIETGDYASLREVDHQQHLSGRVGKPSDIAKACLFLAQEANDFINGENIVVDGGMTRKMIYAD
ncbi:short-chain dehydrogenase [Fictibacillus macauensis ZFHKF-1]|uniref:Short-chain dehydrogenase n=1 Tax=Fictibacillus macauensis ZFHKF-1 TaxID=1196324 RepID=I8AHS4_9BACL|nr:glucose 1-dehydrogenase [Fictibacillus macauensis]EIT84969.1 short-chain dehydrogenase [Fictibacillus macauensis ZFHKF-1]